MPLRHIDLQPLHDCRTLPYLKITLEREKTMTFYAGFDTATYPGNAQLDWLKANTNLSWCGYYLAPAPRHGNTSWMNNRAYLSASGWGLLPVYLGQQTSGPGSHIITAAQGQLDGANAASLAGNDGFAANSYIYLDIEDGSVLSAAATAYVQAWAKAVLQGGFNPSFYCSHGIAAQVQTIAAAINPQTRIWAYRVSTTSQHPYTGSIQGFQANDPAGCGFAGADVWQCEQNTVLTLNGAPSGSMIVDLSTSRFADPSV